MDGGANCHIHMDADLKAGPASQQQWQSVALVCETANRHVQKTTHRSAVLSAQTPVDQLPQFCRPSCVCSERALAATLLVPLHPAGTTAGKQTEARGCSQAMNNSWLQLEDSTEAADVTCGATVVQRF